MVEYVLVLEPENDLANSISNLKKDIQIKFGNQQYLEDPPHLTLYLGYFQGSLLDNIEKFVEKSIQILKKESFSLNGIEFFLEDPVTKKTTAYFRIIDEKNILKLIQNSLIEFMKPYRKKDILTRYKDILFQDKTLNKNLDEYGYPFVGDIWIPHFSLCSFYDKDIYSYLKESFKSLNFKKYTFYRFSIYELDKEEKMILRKSFKI